jgi:hypothetical protein
VALGIVFLLWGLYKLALKQQNSYGKEEVIPATMGVVFGVFLLLIPFVVALVGGTFGASTKDIQNNQFVFLKKENGIEGGNEAIVNKTNASLLTDLQALLSKGNIDENLNQILDILSQINKLNGENYDKVLRGSLTDNELAKLKNATSTIKE